uniref:LAGLIDADG_2 domain-containing protein n=1 Tax=Strongyloides venezuelensis TaxID=75913 RepID=A0A0K0G581_STRVS
MMNVFVLGKNEHGYKYHKKVMICQLGKYCSGKVRMMNSNISDMLETFSSTLKEPKSKDLHWKDIKVTYKFYLKFGLFDNWNLQSLHLNKVNAAIIDKISKQSHTKKDKL